MTGHRSGDRRGTAKSTQRAERAEPAVATDQAVDAPRARTLGELTHWNSVQRGASVALLGAGVASALAAGFGWMAAGAGYALGVLFALAGLFVSFGRETLADRTPNQALWMGTCALLIAGLLSAVLWYFRPEVSNVIVLDGDINIAVLPFAIEGNSGDEDGDLGSSLAGGVAQALSARTGAVLEGTDIRDDVQAMGVELNLSQTPGDLSERAAEIAAEARADFVVTGIVSFDELGTVIRPRVFVAPRRVPDAPELAGWYDGGDDLSTAPDLATNIQSQARAYQDLGDAMGTLIDVGLALENLSIGRAESAVSVLAAVEDGGDFHIVPRELVSLLLGNALGREACPAGQCDAERLQRAADAYARAAEGVSGSARARVGLGELALQRGQGGGGCDADQISRADLDEAESLFRDVVDKPDAPPLAGAKAQLGLARVDACRVAAGLEGAGGSVASIAETLVAQADAGDDAVRHLAAEARSFEAIVAYKQRRFEDARRALDDAIERSVDPERRADWMGLLAKVLSEPAMCELAEAIESLEGAITIRARLIEQADGQLLRALEAERADSEKDLANLRARSECG